MRSCYFTEGVPQDERRYYYWVGLKNCRAKSKKGKERLCKPLEDGVGVGVDPWRRNSLANRLTYIYKILGCVSNAVCSLSEHIGCPLQVVPNLYVTNAFFP